MSEDVFEDDPAGFVGLQVIDMAERLARLGKFATGAVATYAFEMDGVTFRMRLSVADNGTPSND